MPVKRGAALCKTVEYSGCRELCRASCIGRAEQSNKAGQVCRRSDGAERDG